MTIFGWDMSHYDAPDIGSAYAQGIRFVTHKAGGDSRDTELSAWWATTAQRMSSAGLNRYDLLLGSYWIPRPDLHPSASASADDFLDTLDSYCPGWRQGPFILQLDPEIWGGDRATAPNLTYIRTMADRLRSRMPALRPIVYAPKWAYGDSLTGLGYPLWASNYVSGTGTPQQLYPGDASGKWVAYSGQVPAVLQFSSSATIAGQTTCDANAFRGTLAELVALVAPGWVDDVSAADVITALKSADGQAALTAWASTNAARRALYYAIMGVETGRDPKTGAVVFPGIVNPNDPPFDPANPETVKAGTGTQTLASAINRLVSRADYELREVPPTALENAQAVIDVLATTSVHDLESILRTGLTPEGRHALAAALQVD